MILPSGKLEAQGVAADNLWKAREWVVGIAHKCKNSAKINVTSNVLDLRTDVIAPVPRPQRR